MVAQDPFQLHAPLTYRLRLFFHQGILFRATGLVHPTLLMLHIVFPRPAFELWLGRTQSIKYRDNKADLELPLKKLRSLAVLETALQAFQARSTDH